MIADKIRNPTDGVYKHPYRSFTCGLCARESWTIPMCYGYPDKDGGAYHYRYICAECWQLSDIRQGTT